MEKIKNILAGGKCLKLVCGAGNEDVKEIEKLSYVYSSAGFNMIDVSAKNDILNAAISGIKRAGQGNNTALCVSVGLQEDIHLTKAVVNNIKCEMCGNCISVCPQGALFIEDNKILVDEKKCIGCSICINQCKNEAIVSEHKYKAPYAMLLPLLSEQIDCVEFHCSSSNEEHIIDSWNKILSVYNGCLSICIDRAKLSDDKVISIVKKMINTKNDIMIQADGKPMSGNSDDYKSTLQTVAFGELLRSNKIDVFLILSGGTNSKTSQLAKMCNVNINGVAIGSYARKIVKPFINSDDFFENQTLKMQAINAAKELADNILKYL